MSLNVIDVSRYQAGINFPAVKQAGCHAVIVGATYGTAGINPATFAQLDAATAAGLLRGVYHIRAQQATTPLQEANYFLDHIRGYLDGSTIPVLDWEECDTSDEAWALAWLQEVERQTGIKPWFYVNLSDLLTYRYPRIAAAGYALWLAQYPYANLDGFQGASWTPQAIPAGHTLAAWQYVGTGGSLNGYQGLDLSVAYTDAAGWNAYARPATTTDASNVTTIKGPLMALTDAQQTTLFNNIALLVARTGPVSRGTGTVPMLQEIADSKTVSINNNTAIKNLAAAVANIQPAAAVTFTDAQLQEIIAAVPPAVLTALRNQWNK